MTQPGFFDLSRRYESLDQKKDPLVALERLVPWVQFRPSLIAAFELAEVRATASTRKSAAGRKPWDEVIIFKVLVLQALYNLGDDKPTMQQQKDLDARWTQKNGHSYDGYKNHVSVDRCHKLVRCYTITSAACHDSQELASVPDTTNTASDVWADSAYRSAETEAMLAEQGFKSRIHRKGNRKRTLSAREEQANKIRSRARARVEHVFGTIVSAMGGKLVRTIGIIRARAKIGMTNLAYNMKRYVWLKQSAAEAIA